MGGGELLLEKNQPAIAKERLFDTVRQCSVNVGHSCHDKTWAEI